LESLESLAGHRSKRRRELTGGANGGRWWTTVALRLVRGKGREGFYRSRSASRRFLPDFMYTVATTWRGGGWRCASGRRPMAEGGARSGVCTAAAWHQPRGREHITTLRCTVPTTPGLGPLGILASRRAHARVRRRADVACALRRRAGAGALAQTVPSTSLQIVSPNFITELLQSLNIKLAHQLTLYKIAKSSRGFRPTDLT
jgi:hypothetical protein